MSFKTQNLQQQKKGWKRINKKRTNLIKRILIIAAFDLIKNDKAKISNVVIILH